MIGSRGERAHLGPSVLLSDFYELDANARVEEFGQPAPYIKVGRHVGMVLCTQGTEDSFLSCWDVVISNMQLDLRSRCRAGACLPVSRSPYEPSTFQYRVNGPSLPLLLYMSL